MDQPRDADEAGAMLAMMAALAVLVVVAAAVIIVTSPIWLTVYACGRAGAWYMHWKEGRAKKAQDLAYQEALLEGTEMMDMTRPASPALSETHDSSM